MERDKIESHLKALSNEFLLVLTIFIDGSLRDIGIINLLSFHHKLSGMQRMQRQMMQCLGNTDEHLQITNSRIITETELTQRYECTWLFCNAGAVIRELLDIMQPF